MPLDMQVTCELDRGLGQLTPPKMLSQGQKLHAPGIRGRKMYANSVPVQLTEMTQNNTQELQ